MQGKLGKTHSIRKAINDDDDGVKKDQFKAQSKDVRILGIRP